MSTIQFPNIRGIDLNLLGPLSALLEERHVSRAAERANMSQPAMSRALSALRRILDDELLVRGTGGYQLTPRAERLQRDLATALPLLESLFTEKSFDPRVGAHAFRIAGTDYVLSVVGPPLLRRILAQSPRSTLRFDGWQETVYHDVKRGALDVVLTGGAAPPPLSSAPLFTDHFVCVLAAEHPLAAAPGIPLDDYLSCDHVVVAVIGGRQGTVDMRLDALGRPRRASATVPYHALAADAVRGTRLIATLPSRFADGLATDPFLTVTGAPAEIGSMAFAMAWHPRLDDDPAQRWLRQTVRAAAAD